MFEDDNFMKGMGKVRGISEHVRTQDGATLSRPDNTTFTITSASSAARLFEAPVVYLIDKDGVQQRWDHNEQFAEAERRLSSALRKAKG